MTPPSFPTDNLYKFMALADLFLLVFGTVYPSQQVSELEQKRVATQTDRAVLLVQLDALKEDVAIAKKSSQATEAQLERLSELVTELAIKQAQIAGKEAQEKVLTDDLLFAWRTLKVGLALGLLLTLIGFVCWYFRVQKLQDQLLLRQVAPKDDT